MNYFLDDKIQALLKRLNTLSMWLGSLGALGVSLVANFQVFHDHPKLSKKNVSDIEV